MKVDLFSTFPLEFVFLLFLSFLKEDVVISCAPTPIDQLTQIKKKVYLYII